MHLNLLQLIFSLTVDGRVAGEYDLFDLSRRFPSAFRQVTCGRPLPCGVCPATVDCPWFPLFAQQLSTDPEAVKRHQKPPLPFVFGIPLLLPGEKRGDDQELRLTLVGSAIYHAADFIRGVERYCAGDDARSELLLTLDSVSSRGLFDERSPVRMTKGRELSGELQLLTAEDIAGKSMSDDGQVALTFLTPFQQFREGRLLRTLDVSSFLRGVIRRVSSLAAAYGDAELEADFRWLAELSHGIEAAHNGILFTEYAGANRGGMQGRSTLTGNLAPFLPYLFLGEYLHAGKGASWGFGRYELTIDN